MLFLKVLNPKQYDCVFDKQSIGSRSENEPDWFQLEATYYKLVFNCPLTGQCHEHQGASDCSSQRRFHSTGIIHSRTGKGSSYGHGEHEAAHDITHSESHHLLRGVHNLTLCCE